MSATMLEIGDVLHSREFGELRLVDEIGRGGMGVVFEAERPNTSRRYALKAYNNGLALSSEGEARFRREADILGRMRNTRIVKVHAYFRSEPKGVPCIVMDLLHGMTLSRAVKRETKVDLAVVCTIAGDLLGVLDYIHDMDVVHRDIKPDNIFLQPDGAKETLLTLIDFGIFKDLIASGRRADSAFIGTLRYAASEQLTGGLITPRTDFYAAGVVFYELITGRHPFGRVDIRRLQDPSVKPTPLLELAPETPVPIAEVIMAALDRDPQNRPEKANDFARPFRRHVKAINRSRSITNSSTSEGDLIANLTSAGIEASAFPKPHDPPGPGPTGTLRISFEELAGAALSPLAAEPPPAIVPTLPSARDIPGREIVRLLDYRHELPDEASSSVPKPIEPAVAAELGSAPGKGGKPEDSDEGFERQPYAALQESVANAGGETPRVPTLEGSSSSARFSKPISRPLAVATVLASVVVFLALGFGGLWAFTRSASSRASSAPVVTSAASGSGPLASATPTALTVPLPLPTAEQAPATAAPSAVVVPPAPAHSARPAVPRRGKHAPGDGGSPDRAIVSDDMGSVHTTFDGEDLRPEPAKPAPAPHSSSTKAVPSGTSHVDSNWLEK